MHVVIANLRAQVLTLILVICTTAIHLRLLTTSRYGLTFRQALGTADGVGSAVAFMMSILVVWPVGALLLYHTRVCRAFFPGAFPDGFVLQ
jgi:palmitoyltransferase ZDHHC9/14/18